jgi:Tat protein secretion system quality control protein TatD with DNase activity
MCRRKAHDHIAVLQVLRLAAVHDDVHPSLGLHPWRVGDRSEAWLATLRRLLEENPGAGIGEVRLPGSAYPTVTAQARRFFKTSAARHCQQEWLIKPCVCLLCIGHVAALVGVLHPLCGGIRFRRVYAGVGHE